MEQEIIKNLPKILIWSGMIIGGLTIIAFILMILNCIKDGIKGLFEKE